MMNNQTFSLIKKSLSKYPLITVCAAVITLGANAAEASNGFIVDVDAKHNGSNNPIVKFLPAGKYKVSHIGPEQGGLYKARNAWRGWVSGCNFSDTTVCNYGWERVTGIISETNDIPEATGSTRHYSNVYTCTHGVTEKIREEFNPRFATWKTADDALNAMLAAQEAGSECHFTLENDGFVRFHDLDGLTSDNLGGTSYLIESVNAKVSVDIDIKPGSERNPLNMNGHGVIPVAILGSETVDTANINPESLTLAGLANALNGQLYPTCGQEYVNDDEFLDLVCHFRDDTSEWEPSEGRALLAGLTYDGKLIEGSDVFEIVGKKKPTKGK